MATRDAPTRQRTISATIDWSLDLLAPADRALFAQMGVFSAPVSLEAIEATCRVDEGTVVDSLARLVDQSLVRRTTGVEAAPRFSLLELMRERARELLDDVAARRWTDLSHCWIDLVTESLGEVRAARTWAVDTGRDEAVVRIVGSLGPYWHREGHQVEGREWAADALARTEGLDPALVAHLDVAAGFVEWPRTQLGARAHWARAADTYRDLGLRFDLAYALALGAGTYIGDTEAYATAMAQCDEALTLARRVGNHPLIAQTFNVAGELARVEGDDAVALAAYEEGLEHARAADDAAHSSVFIANLAYMASRRGEPTEARRLAQDALRLCWSLGRRMMAAWTVAEIAGPELELGRPERAAVLIGAGDEALRVVGGSRHPGDQPEYERVLRAVRAALGEEGLERHLAEGAAMTLEAPVRLALDEDAAG